MNSKLTIISLCILLLSCSESTTENTGLAQPIVLMENGFEANNYPTLLGWQDNDSIITNRRRFSEDVPSDGGQWSIQIFPPFNDCMSLSYTVYPIKSVQLSNYKLTYWRKTSEGHPNSSVWLNIYYGGSSSSKGRGVDTAADWYKDSIIFNYSGSVVIDSIRIIIDGCPKTPIRPDSLNNVLYDTFKLVQY